MKLSRKKAIALCIELWTWLAETGEQKEDWPRWDDYKEVIDSNCWFCHWNNHTSTGKRRKTSGSCITCLYLKKYRHCNANRDTFYHRSMVNSQNPPHPQEIRQVILRADKDIGVDYEPDNRVVEKAKGCFV